MMRLGICALGAFVITSTAAFAEDGQTPPVAPAPMADLTADLKTTGGVSETAGVVLLGQAKAAPLCPPYCAPRRVTSPEQATVGEREVISVTMAAAAAGPKLHVDSRRTIWAEMEKRPSAVTGSEAATAITQSDFRPALDPVLAEPTPETTE